ncbi:hypothetical protein B6U80_00380 [Candidatus Pacearchaeota archaeon ex4484_26]|nr:MAG: hypothetical protein B6U80_00380 [Candidatus Pacearchaeota archaeon ex4484_26]
MKTKTILVTGGAGFIGSHLCESLLKEGHNVICVDDLSTADFSHINSFHNRKNFRFIKHDITKPFNITNKVDEIYNLACPASPKAYQTMPIKTLFTSSIGLYNTLNIAKKHNAKILHASTSEVYGDPKVSPQDESYYGYVNPTGPRSCYDEGKRFGESLLINYSKAFHIQAKIARIFNTYGPKMKIDDGRAIPNFIYQCLKGEDITIYGNGFQTRSFCYVSDMVNGLKKLMASDTNADPVNLGNPKEHYSIIKVAQIIKKLTKSSSKLSYDPLPKDDPIKRRPSIDKAKKLLKWYPKVNLEKGLKQTIAWFRENI